MDIFIPKFKDYFITSREMPSISSGFCGEYRAILRGPDNRIKSDTGWKPNTILNQGLQSIQRADRNAFNSMYLGDSDAAVDVTQTGLQGTPFPSAQSSYANGSWTPGSDPTWVHMTTRTCTFNAGVNTGTIKEFVFSWTTDPVNNGSVRVVLDVPIVKGASDELTIEHRLYWYPETSDVTGVVTITGLGDYDYRMRHCQIDVGPTSHMYSYTPTNSALFQTHSVGNAGTTLTTLDNYPSWGNDMSPGSTSYGSLAADSFYAQTYYTLGVDTGNFTHGAYGVGIFGKYWQSGGVQFTLLENGDGVTPITKLNTHVLTFGVRTIINRYVP